MANTTRPVDSSLPEPDDESAERTVDVFAAHRDRVTQIHDGLGSSRRIRHFQIHRVLGAGGMGVVHLGWDERLSRPVAIKSLPAEVARDAGRVAALRVEAQNLARLSHPNIGSIYGLEHDETEGAIHLVLEFIDGVTLAEKVASSPCSIEDVVRFGISVARALGFAHDRGIVHRDLKPSNVMIDTENRVRVLDFGIAIALHESTATASSDPALVGTLSYMSPEQIAREPAGQSGDVWALGCLLFELACGQPAFGIRNIHELSRIVDEHPPMQLLPAQMPAELESLISDCLEKRPSDRPSDMHDIARRLTSIHDEWIEPSETWVTARCYALEARVCADDRLPLRISVRVRPNAPGNVEVKLVPSANSRSRLESSGPWIIEPGENWSTVVGVVSLRPGRLELPSLRVESQATERLECVPPSPLAIEVTEPAADLTPMITSLVDTIAPVDPSVPVAWGTWFLLRGSEGSGRALARDVVIRKLRARGFRIIRGTGSLSGRVEHKLLQDFLRAGLGIDDTDHTPHSLRSVVKERLDDYLGRGARESKYFFDLLVDAQSPNSDPGRQLHCWIQLLSALAREAPVALVIDSLPQAAPEVIRLIADTLQRCWETRTPIVAVATTGAGDAESIDLVPGERRDASTVALDLPRLDQGGVETLLELHYPQSSYRDYYPLLAEQILDRASGKLSIAVDLCQALREDRTPNGLFGRVRGGAFVVVPDRSPESIFESRVKGSSNAKRIRSIVPREDWEVLDFCCLMGSEFSIRALFDLGFDSEELDRVLDSLERAGLIEPVDAELEHYRFNDSRIAETVRAAIASEGSRSAARKRGRLAKALITRYANDRASAEWLGLTLIDLNEARRGVRILIEALEHHVDHAKYESAHALFPKIQSVLNRIGPEDGRQELAWYVQRSKVYLARNDSEAADEAIGVAQQVAATLGEPESQARALLLRARLQTVRGEFDAAEATLENAESRANESDQEELTLDVRINRAVVQIRSGRLGAAEETLRQNLLRFDPQEFALGDARSRVNLGLVLTRERRLAEAREQFSVAHRSARRLGHFELETQAHVWLCNLDFAAGRFADARRGYEISVERFRSIQNRLALARAYYNLAQAETMLGRFDRAVAHLENAIHIAQRSGFQADEQLFQVEFAKVLHLCGDDSRAISSLAEARDLASSRSAPIGHYRIDAYAVGIQRAETSLPWKSFSRAMERWTGADESSVETAAWLSIGWLESSVLSAEEIDEARRVVLPILNRIEDYPALLPLEVRLLFELTRIPQLQNDVKGAILRIEARVETGPSGCPRDLYCLARSSVEEKLGDRARWVEKAGRQLEQLLVEILDPGVQSKLRTIRTGCHREYLEGHGL